MLTIDIDSAGLAAIYAAGQVVTLARRVDCLIGGGTAKAQTVAWQVFAPLETNQVSLDPALYCFATATPIQAGAVLTMNSRSAVASRPRMICTLQDGYFSMQSLDVEATTCAATNAMRSGTFGLGLAQRATINGQANLLPTCVCPVLSGQTVVFQPSSTIDVFLSTCGNGGTIVTPIEASLPVHIGEISRIGFDDRSNQFFEIA